MFGKTGGTISTLINMVYTLENIMVSGYKKVKPMLKSIGNRWEYKYCNDII